jgi:hypothetical protein
MTRLGDRRAAIRFQVVGGLWANFETEGSAHLVNIGRHGALIASKTAPTVEAMRVVHLTIDQEEAKVPAIVRHVRSVTDEASVVTYLIGIEFVSRPEIVIDLMTRLGLSP